ncbi:MAG TPA: DUF3667 domain-containing protein, partial [Chitinophagaceae bacterium]|nr:DUF3667 domain-containing protein [Chitinophagaceae bacterium]
MSHQPERAEKDCLNCGTQVQGRYCQACGQENILPHQNFFSLTRHFIYDIFHFDGKFFDTLRYLLFRPGFVPRAYVSGKRMSYLDPIRMYLFTSAVFFLFFFSLTDGNFLGTIDTDNVMDRSERLQLIMQKTAEARQNPADSTVQRQLDLLLDSTKRLVLVPVESDEVQKKYTKKDYDMEHDSAFVPITYKGGAYRMKWGNITLDSAELEDGSWLERRAKQRAQKFNRQYGDDINTGTRELISSFLHQLPYLLFV